MTTTQALPTNARHRYDFICLFDCKDGNYNGDPDAANQPRLDPETGEGLITDVCLKRKIRNFVQLTQNEAEGRKIYVREKAILENLQKDVYAEHNLTLTERDPKGKSEKTEDKADKGAKAKKGKDAVETGRQAMCKRYFDVRTFGAVMSLKEANCGQVRGPIQFTFGRSINPVLPLEHSITRCAVATVAEADKQSGDNRTMGRKGTVPYGLFIARGYFSPHLARQTGFSDSDLELFWNALTQMFEHDRSAARGQMATRQIIVFEHPLPKGDKDDQLALGNAPAHKLFEAFEGYEPANNENAKLPKAQRRLIRLADPALPPRGYEDYIIPTEAEVKARVAKFNINVHYLL